MGDCGDGGFNPVQPDHRVRPAGAVPRIGRQDMAGRHRQAGLHKGVLATINLNSKDVDTCLCKGAPRRPRRRQQKAGEPAEQYAGKLRHGAPKSVDGLIMEEDVALGIGQFCQVAPALRDGCDPPRRLTRMTVVLFSFTTYS